MSRYVRAAVVAELCNAHLHCLLYRTNWTDSMTKPCCLGNSHKQVNTSLPMLAGSG